MNDSDSATPLSGLGENPTLRPRMFSTAPVYRTGRRKARISRAPGIERNFRASASANSIWALSGFLTPAAVLWLLLWFNLNSGPWNLSDRGWPWGYLNALRASLPFVILAVMIAIGTKPAGVRRGSLFYLKVYSWIGLGAAMLSPAPRFALYFGVVHLLAIVVWSRVAGGVGGSCADRKWLAWNLAIAGVYAVALMYIGRGVIFGHTHTGYGIFAEIDEVAGMPMSRSSGIARFAAVPALAAFALMWREGGWRRWLWFGLFALFGFVIYRMQSRGGLFAAAAALVFLCGFAPRSRWQSAVLLLLLVGLLVQPGIRGAVGDYVMRGQDAEEFKSLTGRTEAWSGAWAAFKESPVLGSGNFADRLLLGTHAHNAFIQALLIAGLAGFVPYVLSWVCAWRNLVGLWSVRQALSTQDQTMFLVAGALLIFFTLRSIPETTTASFSVDLLVMVPVMGWLDGRKDKGLRIKAKTARMPEAPATCRRASKECSVALEKGAADATARARL